MPLKPTFKYKIKTLLAISTIACASLCAFPAPSQAQITEFIQSFYPGKAEKTPLQTLLEAGRVGDINFSNTDAIRVFYEKRKDAPIWTGAFGPNVRARKMAIAIANSWTHGLAPERYHLQEIRDRLNDKDPVLQAELEVYLSDAAIKYAKDMAGERLIGFQPAGEVPITRPPLDPVKILEVIADSGDTDGLLNSMVPKSITYKNLQKAYVDLARQPGAAGPEQPISFGGMILRPGMRNKNIPLLRERLGTKQQTADPVLYDDALFAAVMKFQKASGMKDDGVIGDDTVQALNKSNRDRLVQLRVNMERLRWMEGKEKPEKFIVVNIPAATLWAIDKGSVAFEMEVIVGRSERPTPALVTDIKGVRFNPDWTVPPTIKKEDILPKMRADSQYLTNKGIELTYRGENGVETIDPSAIDWNEMTPSQLNALNMVQGPGDHNPLGYVRVLMPNKYSIYLHDTNQRDYFDKYARAVSSGCIRMKEPLKVADFIMNGEKGWNMDKINSVIAKGKTSDRLIANPIPVYIFYYTAWMDDHGRVVFGRDIYSRDKILSDLLDRVDGITVAGHNNIMDNPSGEALASAVDRH